jgi:polar amino acid transport system substrate-binding protein
MRMHTLKAILALLLLPLSSAAADLVVLVDNGTEMPMARFERFELVAGIHRDVGVALASKLGRTPRFVSLPRKRIVRALELGQADVLCSYVPEWLDGSFHWSQPFIPIVELLLSARSAERPERLADLAGKPIGTVLGYAHPELEAVLGSGFLRDDGRTAENNLNKLAAGRIEHAVTVKTTLDYHRKIGTPVLDLHPPMVVKSYLGQCAVSRRARVSVAEVDRAIGKMLADGTVAAIVARYQ